MSSFFSPELDPEESPTPGPTLNVTKTTHSTLKGVSSSPAALQQALMLLQSVFGYQYNLNSRISASC